LLLFSGEIRSRKRIGDSGVKEVWKEAAVCCWGKSELSSTSKLERSGLTSAIEETSSSSRGMKEVEEEKKRKKD
jgi:hypothetical protein